MADYIRQFKKKGNRLFPITVPTAVRYPDGSSFESRVAGVVNAIGDMAKLSTKDKSSLVAAINEALQSGGGNWQDIKGKPTTVEGYGISDLKIIADHSGVKVQIGNVAVVIPQKTSDLQNDSDFISKLKTINGESLEGEGEITIPKGDKGDPGEATTIKGSYETFAELKAAHPVGNETDAYLVAGLLYVWSVEEEAWKSAGNLRGPVGPKGAPGRDGDKGDKMTYADLTEMDKNDLRQPLMVEVDKANESSEESRRESMLAKVAAQEANDSAANTASAMADIQAKIAQIIEMGGQSAADIIASLELANIVALLSAQVQQLEAERLFIVEEDAWESMSASQRTEILEAHINVAIVEGGTGEGTNSFENGTLTLSENCSFENGTLTLADCTFENNILTLKN